MNKLLFLKTRRREVAPLLKIHADVMGYISPVTYPSRYRFIVSFIDSYSRYAGTYRLKHKTDVPKCLREYIISIRNLVGKVLKICYMECDKGTEFTSQKTIDVLNEFGAQLKTVCPSTPEHNGVVERFNQTIQKKLRALMLDSGLPSNMWDIGLGTATHVYNLSPHKTLNMQSPIKLLVGYHPETKRITETKHVKFKERYVYGDVYKEGENERAESTDSEGEVKLSNKRKRGRPRKKVVEPILLYSSLSGIRKDRVSSEYHALLNDITGDPKNYKKILNRHDSVEWLEAVRNEIDAMAINKVFQVVDRPKLDSQGRKPNILTTRWIFKEKVNSEGNRIKKTRLVTRGFQDKNFYNLHETYAPVTRISLVRAVLAFANKHNLTMFQLDVKTAFLNRTVLEEIYIEIPDGLPYMESEKKVRVCKLEKSLYGLKTSPKRWYETFFDTMKELGFVTNENDSCLFVLIKENLIILALLYVDDIILTGNSEKALNKCKEELKKRFRMKDLGEPKEYLGITIIRDRKVGTLKLNQTKFIEQMIQKFGYEQAHPQKSPMMTNRVLNRERRAREGESRNEKVISPTTFREALGSLLYLANATRPNISYAVNILSRHQLNPTLLEWKMLERVFRYLINTKGMSLTYRGKGDGIDGFSDSSLADCKGSITTCGYLVRLYGDIIAWETQKPHYVSLSTCQAEYIAMSVACKEMIALGFSLELFAGKTLYPITLHCDNLSAIKCTEIQEAVGLRHLTEIRYQFVKECAVRGRVNVKWVPSKEQLADIFTKPLSFSLHETLAKKIFNL